MENVKPPERHLEKFRNEDVLHASDRLMVIGSRESCRQQGCRPDVSYHVKSMLQSSHVCLAIALANSSSTGTSGANRSMSHTRVWCAPCIPCYSESASNTDKRARRVTGMAPPSN